MTRSVLAKVRLSLWLFTLCCCATILVVAGAVALGPGDLYEKDQPKTIAYTADIVLHGRFALPRDVIYQPATKPPMYNWIGAAVVFVTRSWSELALKAPSVLAAIGVGGVLFATMRSKPQAAWLAIAMFAAFGVDVRHGSTMRLAFLARPDMLQAFFVTLAWFAATRAFFGNCHPEGALATEGSGAVPRRATLEGRQILRSLRLPQDDRFWAALFWLCVTAAILTKGPLALLLLVYAPIASRLIGGRWAMLRRLHPILGLFATIVCVGAWLACAYRVDPAHVRGVMLGAEIVERVGSQTPEGLSKPFYFAAMWFVTKGGPIAILAVVGMVCVAWRRVQWHRHSCLWSTERSAAEADSPAYGPTQAGMPVPLMQAASLWLIVLIVGLSLPAGKRIDYLLPTYAPAALLAAWIAIELCRRLRVPIVVCAVAPLVLSIQLAHARLTKFGETRERWTDRTVAFCREVRTKIGDESIVVIVRGKHPIPTLLGRHQGSLLTPDDLRSARWAILPTDVTTATPVVVSEPVPSGFEVIESRPLRSLGLYDLRAADAPSEKTLADEQRKAGVWTSVDNPYRAPGTVWRDAE